MWEVFEGRQGQRGLWVVGEVFDSRQGQRGLWAVGVYERGVPSGGGGVGFSRWDAGGGGECRRA